MNPYRKLLVLVPSGHADCAALAQGAELARRSGAELVLHVFDDQAHRKADSATDDGAARRQWMQRTLEQLQGRGIRASGSAMPVGPSHQAMLADIINVAPDLVIKELRRESTLRRLFFTPEDWYLARLSPRPLMMVGQGGPELPTRLIAALDVIADGEPGAELNRRILQEAQTFAAQSGAELHLAHVCEPMADIPEDANLQLLGASSGLMQEAFEVRKARFAAVAEAHGVPEPRRHVVYGRVDRALEDLSEAIGAQLIVAGSNYRSGLERFLLGSTSEDLLAHAQQSVLVIKPSGFDADLQKQLQDGTALPFERPDDPPVN